MHIYNVAEALMAKKAGTTSRRKCIHVKYHYLQDIVSTGQVIVKRIPSANQTADIMIKPLKTKLYTTNRRKLLAPHEHSENPTTPAVNHALRQGACDSTEDGSTLA